MALSLQLRGDRGRWGLVRSRLRGTRHLCDGLAEREEDPHVRQHVHTSAVRFALHSPLRRAESWSTSSPSTTSSRTLFSSSSLPPSSEAASSRRSISVPTSTSRSGMAIRADSGFARRAASTVGTGARVSALVSSCPSFRVEFADGLRSWSVEADSPRSLQISHHRLVRLSLPNRRAPLLNLSLFSNPNVIMSEALQATLTLDVATSSLCQSLSTNFTLLDPSGAAIRKFVTDQGSLVHSTSWTLAPGGVELWWSVGLGPQPLYTVKAELFASVRRSPALSSTKLTLPLVGRNRPRFSNEEDRGQALACRPGTAS